MSLLSFLLIGASGLACMGSGLLSRKIAPQRVATTALAFSGLCCLVSPLVLRSQSGGIFLSFLFCWGLVVVADSPMFFSLVAQSAPEASRGTALTIVNCIGFALTVVSIQVTSWLSGYVQAQDLYLLLTIVPALGLLAQLDRRREVATAWQ